MPQSLIGSTDACLDRFYIMAFTSDETRADAADDSGHAVEIMAAGDVRSIELYNRVGDDYSRNKGDLWKYDIASFNFPSGCVTISNIERVSIIESSNDAWRIASIVTLVGADGSFKVLTKDLNVNRWIDGNSEDAYRSFELTFA